MSRPTDTTNKLKGADPEISMYTLELEKENFKLQKKVAKLQGENITKDNGIKVLKKALEKERKKGFTFKIEYVDKPVKKE